MILTTDSRIIGIDSNNKQVRLCRFEVDAISELPAPDVWASDGVIICMGSTAHVIVDNSEHMLDSSGQWVQQVAGTSSYTRAEIDAMLSAIDAEIETLTPAAIKAVDEGAKNLLEITATTQTINGVAFTVNADQTITINGTSQERAQFLLRPVTVYPGMQGCILSGAVQNDQNVTLRFQLGANPWTVYANDSGSGTVIQNYDDSSPIQVYINVPAGVTVSNLIFNPMICTAADWAVSQRFVPYCPTNRDLYEMILALQ